MTNLIDSSLIKIGFHRVYCGNSIELLKQNILSVLNTSAKNVFIGFSGGSMPQLLAPLLNEISDELISNILLFPVDERLVPLQCEESNTGTLLRELSNKDKFENKILKISDDSNLLEVGSKIAFEFENKLRSMNPKLDDNGFPIFDLLLLGLGPDGHTCSLFPNHPLLEEKSHWIAYIDDSPKPPPKRITLTLPVLSAAKNIIFIASGKSKAKSIAKIIETENNSNQLLLPPNLIKRREDQQPIKWFLDEEAISDLNISNK
ncbi:hypothetical protein ACQ4LE_005255 [Meloidogyne hapla]